MPTVTAGSVDVSIIGGKGDGGGQRDRCGQPPRRKASPPAAREPVRQNARESWTGLKGPRLWPTERVNGPTAAVGDPVAAAEAACEAPT